MSYLPNDERDLSAAARARLGVDDEGEPSESYSSYLVFSPEDSFATALSKLDAAVAATVGSTLSSEERSRLGIAGSSPDGYPSQVYIDDTMNYPAALGALDSQLSQVAQGSSGGVSRPIVYLENYGRTITTEGVYLLTGTGVETWTLDTSGFVNGAIVELKNIATDGPAMVAAVHIPSGAQSNIDGNSPLELAPYEAARLVFYQGAFYRLA